VTTLVVVTPGPAGKLPTFTVGVPASATVGVPTIVASVANGADCSQVTVPVTGGVESTLTPGVFTTVTGCEVVVAAWSEPISVGAVERSPEYPTSASAATAPMT